MRHGLTQLAQERARDGAPTRLNGRAQAAEARDLAHDGALPATEGRKAHSRVTPARHGALLVAYEPMRRRMHAPALEGTARREVPKGGKGEHQHLILLERPEPRAEPDSDRAL